MPTEPLAETMQLIGGMLWRRKGSGVPGYSAENGNFDILIGNGYVVLVAFKHEPIDGSEFWRKRFDTLHLAMHYAECM